MGFSRVSCLLGVAAASIAFAVSSSQAALILDIQNGASIINDNGAGDSDPTVGRIINTSVVAGFGLSITVAASNSPGDPDAGVLQIQSLDIQNGNAIPASLKLRLSDTDFTLPGTPGASLRLESSVGGTFTLGQIGDSLKFESFADPANGQPAGPVVAPALNFLRNTGATTENFDGSSTIGWVRGAGAYSLTNITTVTLSPGGQMNVSGTTAALPEPAAACAALGLAGIAVRRRQRR